ncbi:MAG: Na+/H+ antiporter NhaC family protein [Bacteroidales bacterium]|nr:Na+/H+ antiporter NhaC family protein [Bacteroidales bacterium]
MSENIRNIAERRPNFFALTPLIVFLAVYLVASLILNDFYKVPITVAFITSSVYAIAITRKLTLNQRITRFSRGAGNKNIMLMIWIFVLAGAFAQSAKSMGGVQEAVNIAIKILPDNFLLPGMFLTSCFISLAVGTSVGTIAALMPVAAGIASQTGISTALMSGIIVGGAYFGDNLSFISDTTVIATKSQGCEMKDKFSENIRIVLPAAIIVAILYFFIGKDIHATLQNTEIQFLKIVPYLVVLIPALFGSNVLTVLLLGTLFAGIIGIFSGSYDIFGWFAEMGKGILSMSELIIVTLLAGGMLELIRYNGGMDYLVEKLSSKISGRRASEFSIAFLVFFADLCTANNTVAIITVGQPANKIAKKFGINPKRTASLLDTFSCFAQGIIPYGAQMLLAAGFCEISPSMILPYLFYPFLMGFCAILSILIRKNN